MAEVHLEASSALQSVAAHLPGYVRLFLTFLWLLKRATAVAAKGDCGTVRDRVSQTQHSTRPAAPAFTSSTLDHHVSCQARIPPGRLACPAAQCRVHRATH